MIGVKEVLVSSNNVPDQMKQVIDKLNSWIKNPTRETVYDKGASEDGFQLDYYWAHSHGFREIIEWSIGANAEDGTPSFIYVPVEDQWYIRPWMSEVDDTPIEFDLDRIVNELVLFIAP